VARLHAAWWENESLAAIGWLPPRPMDFLIAGFAATFPVFLDRFADLVSTPLAQLLPRLPAKIAATSKRLGQEPQTLQHGDVKLDNLFFRTTATGVELTIFDWGSIARGPAAYDLAYFLGESLEPEEARRHLPGLLRTYHTVLVSEGISGYSSEQLAEDFRLQFLSCLLRRIVVGGSRLTPGQVSLFRPRTRRFLGIAELLDVRELLA